METIIRHQPRDERFWSGSSLSLRPAIIEEIIDITRAMIGFTTRLEVALEPYAQKPMYGAISNNRWHDYRILTYLIWALWVHATYSFTQCVTKSCDLTDSLIQTCYQSALSRVTETTFLTWPCGTCFQKCFSVENLIIVSLNTVIPIIVIV